MAKLLAGLSGRLAIFAIVAASQLVAASAEQPRLLLIGEVSDRIAGGPVAGAVITLRTLGGASTASTKTNPDGTFRVERPAAGRYRLTTTMNGYVSQTVWLHVWENDTGSIHIALDRSGPTRIGRSGSRSARTTAASAGQRLDADALRVAGGVRTADALATLPGVTITGDALAPGGDAYVSLRGLRPGESQTLLDGHPIGPIGVLTSSPDADGTIAGFNYQDAPYFALGGVNVTFGATGSDRDGSSAVGGAIDLQTFNPTARAQTVIDESFGNEGRTSTALRATGTTGKLGYAIVDGVLGTTGLFSGDQITQSGLRATDLTSSTRNALTYAVSGDYVLRNDLAKLVYAPSTGMRIALSAYGATSWADKTGEGDNDFNTYAYTLANAPVGASAACPRGVLVTTDMRPACLSPGAYAAAASGPAGGGPGAWQALRNQDDDVKFTSSVGKSAMTVDAFTDAYGLLYHRDASLVTGPLDAFLDRWSTQGLRFSDDLGSGTNAFGFGASWVRQTLSGDATLPDGSAVVTDAPTLRINRSLFVRDAFAPIPRLSLAFNGWLSSATGDPVTHVDPALSLVYRPSRGDAFRFAAGATTDEPGLDGDRVNLVPAGALNPDCGAIARATTSASVPVDVGSGPPGKLAPETGSDLELGFDHQFGTEGTLGLTLYDANIVNRIVTGQFAAGGALTPGQTAPIFERIRQFCGLTPQPGAVTLTLDESFNAASARLRGLELGGHANVAKHVSLIYAFDVQSIVLNDLPAAVLRTDPTLVNGLQVFEVPLHKATLGIDFVTPFGLDVRLDGHALGPNNPQQLPGYAYADASMALHVSRRVLMRLAVGNIFDSHAQTYGLVGYGLAYPTNPFNTATASPFTQPFNERYGIEPTSLTLNATIAL